MTLQGGSAEANTVVAVAKAVRPHSDVSHQQSHGPQAGMIPFQEGCCQLH